VIRLPFPGVPRPTVENWTDDPSGNPDHRHHHAKHGLTASLPKALGPH
jgi:hypothetical protein